MASSNKTMRSIIILLLVLLIILTSSFFVMKDIIEPLVSSISGKVIKGDGDSRKYGYPTANMKIKEELPCGVFNGESQYGTTTVLSNGKNFVEAHIHNFNKNIYGETLKIKNLGLIQDARTEPGKDKPSFQDCIFAKGFIDRNSLS
jgi:hypothetical protein